MKVDTQNKQISFESLTKSKNWNRKEKKTNRGNHTQERRGKILKGRGATHVRVQHQILTSRFFVFLLFHTKFGVLVSSWSKPREPKETSLEVCLFRWFYDRLINLFLFLVLSCQLMFVAFVYSSTLRIIQLRQTRASIFVFFVHLDK